MNDDYRIIAPLIRAAHNEEDFKFAFASREEGIEEVTVPAEKLDDFIKENLLQNTTERAITEKLKEIAD